MKTVELKAKVRESVGKSQAKKVRALGAIPANVYGSGSKRSKAVRTRTS